MMITMMTIVLAAMMTPAHAGKELRPLLEAIRHVETGSHPKPANAVGDSGRSLGPYQISRKYWQDSGVPGAYASVRSCAYAERVILAYWRRHCPDALARRDFQTLARVHNGGPSGDRRRSTITYWRKVQSRLE